MRKFVVIVASLAALVLVAWGGLHLLISPVHPEQELPTGHSGAPCWTCHIVTPSAEVRDIR